ncbi:hypothetical protein F8S09_15390 [Deinococcus sp. SDU3-2]|uniref:Uncharacterized protein n=1 Tax=Deinococcus terrestris TaxID=2651870 RepID=A0A7X1NZ87_9DEIO|nr:hypothetical protein [Deinococcus terrestris]MPY68039.1 hypothetical protein [Deinococcus terrestris]
MNRCLRVLFTLLPLVGLSLCLAQNVEADIDATHQAVQNYVTRSVGTFERFQQITLGDPASNLYEAANQAKKVGLPTIIMTLATVIATLGFLVRGWSIVTSGDSVSKRGVFVQALAVSFLLSISFNNASNMSVSYTALTSWNNSVNWANSMFTGAVDAKLEESSKILVGVLGKVAVTATTFAAPELRAVGAATAKGTGGAALKEAGKKAAGTMARIGAKLNFSLALMQGLISAYATIIYISGMTVLFGIYLFPIGVALTLWGQTKVVWLCVGSFLAAWMIALALPLVTYLAIDKVFVEPARIAAVYEKELGVVAKISGTQSALVGERFDSTLDGVTRLSGGQKSGQGMRSRLQYGVFCDERHPEPTPSV